MNATRFVLVNTSHPGNVGSVARAMKVMGFNDLVLVNPRFANVLTHPEAHELACGADDILEHAKVVSTLEQALDAMTWVCATAMTPRDFGPPTYAPRTHFASLAQMPHQVAFVFGSERYGLSNQDVYRCHACLSIPTAADFSSLNLAQAVQLIAYEWRQAIGSYPVNSRTAPTPLYASAAEIQGLLDHWEEALISTGFLKPAAPKKLLPRLNQLLNRAQPTSEEIHLLRGIARSILRLRQNDQ